MTYSKNRDALKSQLAKHYNEKSLTAAQISALKELEEKSSDKETLPRSYVWGTGMAMAAMLMLAVSVWTFWYKGYDYNAISAEIAYNHNSQMQMEILSNSFVDIDSYLNRLDFALITPKQLPVDKWTLLGARYCSIDGKIAAQFQVEDLDTKRIYTFYQAKLPQGVDANLNNVVIDIDGVSVALWEENGLLMGLAK
ncbi:hypothetical protein L4D06_23845 [Enterovibrio makurazakiensis]|uniref:DUF3379 domain-containing protein n=1 Tax=Enterovibrio gelatinilyticus TaxID=2899819 RepID=A0ABT5R478_9GAMM|nr:hypothetical protein [Enterovibrio sp. ZSDZ42]MDD1795082.1 hypothetical protein [Enterovibrio sp. ZSDZ42]